MFSDGNSDLLSLSGTQIFFFVPYSWHVDHIISHFFTELKIYHQSLIFNFNIFCTTDLWYSKCFKIVPNSSKLKWPQLVSWKSSYMFFAVYFFQVLILVNGNLSVILSRSPCPRLFLQNTIYFSLLNDRNQGWQKWLFSEEDSLAGNNDQF